MGVSKEVRKKEGEVGVLVGVGGSPPLYWKLIFGYLDQQKRPVWLFPFANVASYLYAGCSKLMAEVKPDEEPCTGSEMGRVLT